MLSYKSSQPEIPRRESAYGIASLCLSTLILLVHVPFPGPSPMTFLLKVWEPDKLDLVACVGSVLGMLLAWAGWQQSDRKHTTAKIGLAISGVAFVLWLIMPPL